MKKFDLKKTVAKAKSLDYKKLARDFVYGKPAGEPFDISGRVGSSTELQSGKQHLTLEFAALRVINVENLGGDRNAGTSGADVSI